MLLVSLKDIRRKIGVVFDNPDNHFVSETVIDDLAFSFVFLQYDKEGNFIREWDTMSEAEKYYNKNRTSTNISSCCRGERKSAGGYIWKYK